jgi:putative glutamine amidotransferase
MDGLLLTGGSDISPEFLRQKDVDPSLLDKHIDQERDRWEFEAVREALSRGLPIFAICKGLQVFNVALGGTLKLDIKGHNLPEQRDREVQRLRHARRAAHRFLKVNSAHHQAIEQLGDDLEVEAWSATTVSSSKYICANILSSLAPSISSGRSRIYDGLFEDFLTELTKLTE